MAATTTHRLTEVLNKAIVENSELTVEGLTDYVTITNYIVSICATFADKSAYHGDEWTQSTVPYLSAFMSSDQAAATSKMFLKECASQDPNAVVDCEEEEEGVDLCNVEFSLAYGGKILLHDTRLWLKRGHRYGLLGHNGCGKTTLMSNIASGNLEGLPDSIRRVYVQHDIVGDNSEELTVLGYMEKELITMNVPKSRQRDVLCEVGFTPVMLDGFIVSLSGGWRMRLALARAMLMDADLLLLDEPTNHLDVTAVAWLVKYLTSLKDMTVLVVSHDAQFLTNVVTDVIHYETRKLVRYPGTLADFVKKKPEAKAYYELASSNLAFHFPAPGRLEGVNSRTRTVLRLANASYTYPNRDVPTITDITVSLTLCSRVGVLGANGAGKSTLIKLLVGETLPDGVNSLDEGSEGSEAECYKHHNLRVAYVAQHSFHHVEQHLESSPVQYIQWRFSEDGQDKELLDRVTMKMSAEELEKKDKTIEELRSRRKAKKGLEYEVKWVGRHEKHNTYLHANELKERGWAKEMMVVDSRINAVTAGLDLQPLTTTLVQTHLDDFGLESEFGTHGKIRGLSGGQKVKLVLAAAMWNRPHLMVLDEPTNYLDRDSLGALATAIKEFEGGVIMISHNQEFVKALANENWCVEGGKCVVQKLDGIGGEVVVKAAESAAKGGDKLSPTAAKRQAREAKKAAAVAEAAASVEGEAVGNTNATVDQSATMSAKVMANGKLGRAEALSAKELRKMKKLAKKGVNVAAQKYT